MHEFMFWRHCEITWLMRADTSLRSAPTSSKVRCNCGTGLVNNKHHCGNLTNMLILRPVTLPHMQRTNTWGRNGPQGRLRPGICFVFWLGNGPLRCRSISVPRFSYTSLIAAPTLPSDYSHCGNSSTCYCVCLGLRNGRIAKQHLSLYCIAQMV